MKNSWILALIILGLTFASSCKDDDEEEHNHSDGTFEYHAHIMSPNTENKMVGDSIHLHIDFEEHAGQTIHHINVKIYQKDDPTNIIYDKPTEAHIHETSGTYGYHDDFVLDNVPGHKDWVMEAKIWAEEEGKDEAVETIEFHVHPQ